MDRRPVCFISGPMSGLEDAGRAVFNAMEQRLREEKKWHVLNPACLPTDLSDVSYMPICLAMLRECDIVLMLPGWRMSVGAMIEHDFAVKCGITVLEAEDLFGEEDEP